jgi:hypothetical protein
VRGKKVGADSTPAGCVGALVLVVAMNICILVGVGGAKLPSTYGSFLSILGKVRCHGNDVYGGCSFNRALSHIR